MSVCAGGDGANICSPSLPTDPLIAVCAGSTTRGVDSPDEDSLALFRYLLPSLERTAECGFNYLAVIGYDVGDMFFDSDAGTERVSSQKVFPVGVDGVGRGGRGGCCRYTTRMSVLHR